MLTTASPGLKMSWVSSWAKLKRFSDRPLSALTVERNSRMTLTALGILVLSGCSSGVFFRTVSSSKGYLARRVVGFVR